MSFTGIFDTSVYIHTGMGTQGVGSFRYHGVPTGGIYFLLQELLHYRSKSYNLIIGMDSKTNRRDFVPTYKKSRPHDPDIVFQCEAVARFFPMVFSNVFRVEGFEYDDLCFSYFEKMRRKQVRDAVIAFTADDDISHNIVDEYDYIEPANSNYYRIDMSNFEDILSEDSYRVPLNSITASKCIFGDSSDGYPEISPKGYTKEQVFKMFLNYCKKKNINTRNKESMIQFNKDYGEILGVYGVLANNIEVAFPRYCELPDYRLDNDTNENLSRLLSLFGMKKFLKRLKLPYIEYPEDIQVLKDMYARRERLSYYHTIELSRKDSEVETHKFEKSNSSIVGGFDI